MLKAEEILKLVEAGYTKEEITKMMEAEPSQEEEHKSSEEAQDVPDQEEQPVKKNSESVSEENKDEEIKQMKEKLNSLEQRFFAKNREEATIPSTPPEDLSLPTIFKSLQEEN